MIIVHLSLSGYVYRLLESKAVKAVVPAHKITKLQSMLRRAGKGRVEESIPSPVLTSNRAFNTPQQQPNGAAAAATVTAAAAAKATAAALAAGGDTSSDDANKPRTSSGSSDGTGSSGLGKEETTKTTLPATTNGTQGTTAHNQVAIEVQDTPAAANGVAAGVAAAGTTAAAAATAAVSTGKATEQQGGEGGSNNNQGNASEVEMGNLQEPDGRVRPMSFGPGGSMAAPQLPAAGSSDAEVPAVPQVSLVPPSGHRRTPSLFELAAGAAVAAQVM